LATRAVYSFTGFPGAAVRHLYLHHDGYPTGAAWRFASALRLGGDAADFLDSFLSSQPRAEALTRAEEAADAEYRYGVHLVGGADPHHQVECWRRLPGDTCWQHRCGPMTLELFIRRFLPGDPQPKKRGGPKPGPPLGTSYKM
jgi:hypothetical protein